ncbi:hypothetical protein COB72_01710 [bacterium]|nr:MAG: hypothetical protein COB72_01710 [bacterium]
MKNLNTISIIAGVVGMLASSVVAQVTPIQSSAEANALIYITQSEFSDSPIALAEQLTTITNLTALAFGFMDNEHGVFSSGVNTFVEFDDVDSGTVDVSLTFQGAEAAGAPPAGGFGHGLAGEFLYEFSLAQDGDIEFNGMMINSSTVFEGFTSLIIGEYNQSGVYQGPVFQQSVIDTGNLGTVSFNFSTPLAVTDGHYELSIKFGNSGIGLRDEPEITSSMNCTFVINTTIACPADLTGDGVLNFFDVSVFLYAFGAMNPIADLNGDGIFNFFDVSAFLAAFAAGCP